MTPITIQQNTLTIHIRVSPRAKRTGIEGIWNQTHIKIAVPAPAVDDKANDAVIQFLANTLDIPKSRISILSGHKNRLKHIQITTDNPQKLADKIKTANGST